MMARVENFTGITAFFTLATIAFLSGCTHQEATAATSAGTDVTQLSVTSDGLPEVVVVAHRPTAKEIVLSARDSGVAGK
jgi:hypothetical protein